MATKELLKKVERLEKEVAELKKPRNILGKIYVDGNVLKQAAKAPFDFDIEAFVSKKDLKKPWK